MSEPDFVDITEELKRTLTQLATELRLRREETATEREFFMQHYMGNGECKGDKGLCWGCSTKRAESQLSVLRERERELVAALDATEDDWITKAGQQLLSAAESDDPALLRQLASTAFHIMEDRITSRNRAALASHPVRQDAVGEEWRERVRMLAEVWREQGRKNAAKYWFRMADELDRALGVRSNTGGPQS